MKVIKIINLLWSSPPKHWPRNLNILTVHQPQHKFTYPLPRLQLLFLLLFVSFLNSHSLQIFVNRFFLLSYFVSYVVKFQVKHEAALYKYYRLGWSLEWFQFAICFIPYRFATAASDTRHSIMQEGRPTRSLHQGTMRPSRPWENFQLLQFFRLMWSGLITTPWLSSIVGFVTRYWVD